MPGVEITDTLEIYTRPNLNGYGYEICSRTFIDWKEDGNKRHEYKLLFHSFDKNLILSLYEDIKKLKSVPETWPDTSKEVPPMRIFRFESKHYTYHFDAQTPEKLEAAARKVLNDESPYWAPDVPKNDSGIESIEELDLVGIDPWKTAVEEKFNRYQKEFKQYKIDRKNWEDLQLVIKGGGNLRDVLNVLREYESGRYEILDLDEV